MSFDYLLWTGKNKKERFSFQFDGYQTWIIDYEKYKKSVKFVLILNMFKEVNNENRIKQIEITVFVVWVSKLKFKPWYVHIFLTP